LSAADK